MRKHLYTILIILEMKCKVTSSLSFFMSLAWISAKKNDVLLQKEIPNTENYDRDSNINPYELNIVRMIFWMSM